MNKKLTTLILVFCISAVALKSTLSAGMAGKTILPDGYILRGVEGKLVRKDANDVWLFEFDSVVSDGKGRIEVGARLELLPSSALEKMIADANDRTTDSYKLWARLTKYKGRNFIFSEYFLSLSKVRPQSPSTLQPSQEKAKPAIDDPNDQLLIPKEILDKLKTRRTIRRRQPEGRVKVKQNSVLNNRAGFISSCVMRPFAPLEGGDAYCADRNTQYGIRNTRYVFVFDAFGRSIQQTSLRLLPCQALELAEQQADAALNPIRFKIAGIVTEYKGKKYLLLQRATRVYSHENFGY